MSGTMGPYKPAPGWMTRWSKQSLQLLLRSPQMMIVAYLLGGFYAIAHILIMVCVGNITGSSMFAVLARNTTDLLISTIIFGVLTNIFLKSDGHPPLSADVFRFRLRPAVHSVLNLAMILCIITAVVSLMAGNAVFDGSLGRYREVASGPISGYFKSVSGLGHDLMLIVTLSPFLLVGSLCLGLAHDDRMIMEERIRQKIPGLQFSLSLLTILLILQSMILPVWLMPIAYCWICGFLYVAGREVLGGIDGNGESETQTKAVYAP